MPYKMPAIEAGMTVVWSPGHGATFVPALVTKVGVGSISVALLRSGATSFVPKESVRHVTDPGFRRLAEPTKTGCWEYRDQDVLLALVAKRILGGGELLEVCPAFATLVADYTPEREEYTRADRDGDDPDNVGA